MPGAGVAALLAGELALLELRVGGHAALAVGRGQVEHAVVERVEAGERDELELVAQARQLVVEGEHLVLGQVALPVERRGAVVGERLAGELGVDRVGEAPGLVEVGLRRLAPQQVRVRRVGERAGDGLVDA